MYVGPFPWLPPRLSGRSFPLAAPAAFGARLREICQVEASRDVASNQGAVAMSACKDLAALAYRRPSLWYQPQSGSDQYTV